MSLFAQKRRPEMVATIYGSSQAQLSEKLGIIHALRRAVLANQVTNHRKLARGNRYKKAPLLRGCNNFIWAVALNRPVVRKNVPLRLFIQHGNIVLSEVDDAYPVTGRVRYFRFCGYIVRATRGQHRHQEDD